MPGNATRRNSAKGHKKYRRATTIVITLRSHDWHARIKRNKCWANGKTDREAIGNLLQLHPREVTGPLQYEYVRFSEGDKKWNPLIKGRELKKGTWCKIVDPPAKG